MKNSLIILAFFCSGIAFGLLPHFSKLVSLANFSIYVLYLLMFLVGIGVGSNSNAWSVIKTLKVKILFIPISIAVGTLLAVGLLSLLIPGINLKESLAIGSGLGYYSLASILITQLYGEKLGLLALLTNIFRESLTLLFAPLLVRYFGKLSPIASGGVTSMDTSLSTIAKVSGKEVVLISIFSGVVLTILVPFLISFILTY
ncbi:MAG: hypothetical protein B5M53_11825 [Candidatus Cloacimonas sp. 4484_209]|nr:MAG: hypothetical protein B5M53_11825 [Candidatus Cloacimonas sp. 4484_209]